MSFPIILVGLIVAVGALIWWFKGAKPKSKGILRVVLGLMLCGLATIVYDYTIRFACVMDPAGCSEPPISLYIRHLVQEEGIVCLLVMTAGLVLIGSGLKLRHATG